MNLHHDKEAFKELIIGAANELAIPGNIIEKDYYVTLILRKLSQIEYPVVFKGGTSLSKAYNVIDRFSEDIDITFTEHLGDKKRKKLKYNVLKPISEKLRLKISNWEYIESDKNLNHYDFCYESVINEGGIIPAYVKLETSLMMYSFPTNNCKISNYLYDILNTSQKDIFEKYSLLPFEMRVQSLERTLIDKVFAVCDYYLLKKSRKNARHLYDIYKLQKHVNYDEGFLELVQKVREQRIALGEKIAPEANLNVNIKLLAEEVCESDFYKSDYDDTTVFMISEKVSYETVKRNYLDVVKKIWK